jgi:hypothetical protein
MPEDIIGQNGFGVNSYNDRLVALERIRLIYMIQKFLISVCPIWMFSL